MAPVLGHSSKARARLRYQPNIILEYIVAKMFGKYCNKVIRGFVNHSRGNWTAEVVLHRLRLGILYRCVIALMAEVTKRTCAVQIVILCRL